jgi:hypothetical protein
MCSATRRVCFTPESRHLALTNQCQLRADSGCGNLRRSKTWMRIMFSKLKAAWARMTGGRAAGESDEPSTPAIEYQGYRIRPTPYRTEGQYQTAGIIEKNFPDGPKQHRFVRADTHYNRDDAAAFAILKAKQIIDMQGDRMFT